MKPLPVMDLLGDSAIRAAPRSTAVSHAPAIMYPPLGIDLHGIGAPTFKISHPDFLLCF
jgi:hypothetical protein